MNQLRVIFLTIVVFSILSCSNLEEGRIKAFRKDFNINPSSHILELIDSAKSIASSHPDSSFIVNYSTGEPWLKFRVSNNVLDSSLIEYYECGRIKSLFHFNSGNLKYGKHGEFYNKSLVYFFINASNDTMRSETSQYKTYYFGSPRGELLYKRSYNEVGEPTSSEGNLITDIKAIKKDSSKMDSTLYHFYVVDEPYPSRYYDMERQLRLNISNKDQVVIYDTLDINYDVTAAFYLSNLTEPGNYEFNIVASITDLIYTPAGTDTSSIQIDTTTFNVNIK